MNDIALIQQTDHDITFKVELYDTSYTLISAIEGDAMSMTSTISSTSDIRRTCNLVLHVSDPADVTEDFEVSWIDRIVRPYIGIKNSLGTYEYYSFGSYLLSDDDYGFDLTTSELTLNLVDMMGASTEARGSQLGTALTIPYGTNVRSALIATAARYSPFTTYNICEFPDVIPYDLEFQAGTYAHDIFATIMNLFPYYELFYTLSGVLTARAIPTGYGASVTFDEDDLDPLIISERRSKELKNIKNTTEIWGQELDAQYVASACVNTSGDYALTIATTFTTLEPNSTYAFTPDADSVAGQTITIQDFDPITVYDYYGNALAGGEMVAGVACVVKHIVTLVGEDLLSSFRLQGPLLIHVIVRDVLATPDAGTIATDKLANNCNDIQYIVNAESPYACDRNGMDIDEGEIKQVLFGGEYSNIYSTALAYERAAYENWKRTRLQPDVELKTMLIPWADVNIVIQYTSPTTASVSKWLVKDITFNPTEFTMTWKLAKFYAAYPWVT